MKHKSTRRVIKIALILLYAGLIIPIYIDYKEKRKDDRRFRRLEYDLYKTISHDFDDSLSFHCNRINEFLKERPLQKNKKLICIGYTNKKEFLNFVEKVSNYYYQEEVISQRNLFIMILIINFLILISSLYLNKKYP